MNPRHGEVLDRGRIAEPAEVDGSHVEAHYESGDRGLGVVILAREEVVERARGLQRTHAVYGPKRGAAVVLIPEEGCGGSRSDDGDQGSSLDASAAAQWAEQLVPKRGSYVNDALPNVHFEAVPSEIEDGEGNAVAVIGLPVGPPGREGRGEIKARTRSGGALIAPTGVPLPLEVLMGA